MMIRKSTLSDINDIEKLYTYAREFMSANGNPDQWIDGYPSLTIIEDDIKSARSYVYEHEGTIACVFYFSVEEDPTYKVIYKGSWLDDSPYGVIHRMASNGSVKGIATKCIKWCLTQHNNIRIDTSSKNIPMHNLLIKCGFKKCGTIIVANGSLRNAYHLCPDKN